MNKQAKSRLPALLLVLALTAMGRWLDPLSLIEKKHVGEVVSLPVSRDNAVASTTIVSGPVRSTANRTELVWPIRRELEDLGKDSSDPFITRSEAAAHELKRHPAPAPLPPPPYVPPSPPPPPVEPPPPLHVIGTWGEGQKQAVFLAGPNGTMLAKEGETLLGKYLVQTVSNDHLVLTQIGIQRSWQLAIPTAPSTPQTWSGPLR